MTSTTDGSAGRPGSRTLRRSAAALVGEDGARSIARQVSRGQVFARTRLTGGGRADAERLRQYRNVHLGERCVIVGNGPSLNRTPMNLLRGEFTFGLNRIYMMFEELGFSTTYLVVVNKYVVEQCREDFAALRSPLFTTRPNRAHLAPDPQRHFLEKVNGPYFARDATLGVWEGATVTYVAMQLAFFMGFSRVILVGVDHNFVTQGAPHKLVESAGTDENHFNPAYFGKGFKWQLPDLVTSEIAYRMAQRNFEVSGRSIVDATVDGKLDVFPKADLATELGK